MRRRSIQEHRLRPEGAQSGGVDALHGTRQRGGCTRVEQTPCSRNRRAPDKQMFTAALAEAAKRAYTPRAAGVTGRLKARRGRKGGGIIRVQPRCRCARGGTARARFTPRHTRGLLNRHLGGHEAENRIGKPTNQAAAGDARARLEPSAKGAPQDVTREQAEETESVQEAAQVKEAPLPTIRLPPTSEATLLQPSAPPGAVVKAGEAGGKGLGKRAPVGKGVARRQCLLGRREKVLGPTKSTRRGAGPRGPRQRVPDADKGPERGHTMCQGGGGP